MLSISHLTKKYGRSLACNDISFQIPDGEVAILLGPNGAGKSTLMKSVIGVLRYNGEISVSGLNNKTPEARKIVGYIPEMPALYPNLTVSEHMEFIARAYKLENYKDRVSELLDMFELTDKKKKFGDELSKGMQQKLNICLGLLPDPDLILMDEPMIGLDPHAIKELKREIEAMRNRGKTLLISTHIIDSVDMIWDRTIILQNGNMRADVTKKELDGCGLTLEEYFFRVTEQENPSAGAETEDKK
ncbi:MAG: ABC transporter ATP-binding protein [Clostridia bacterium]|nr:ABC transporter ATP-binding protein [Clostridia bacterium]